MFIRANTFPVQPGKTDEAVNVFRDSVALICQKQVPRENDMTTHKP
jgi:heme-degrading monooxygenase HmoA